MKEKYQGRRGQRSKSLCNFIVLKGTISTINDVFALNWGKMGQMVSEKHHIINKFTRKEKPKILILQMAGCKFGKTMPVN